MLTGESCNGEELRLDGTVLYNRTLDLSLLPGNNSVRSHNLVPIRLYVL